MTRRYTLRARIAGLAALASAIFAGWSVMRAIEIDELPTGAEATALGDVTVPARRVPPRANIAAAVEADPFSPARTRPVEAYRLPGELVVAGPAPRVEQLRVLGTVVSTTGSGFAMCQLGSQPPAIVRVGQKIGVYTLKRVARGSATFASPSGDVVIAAPQPGR